MAKPTYYEVSSLLKYDPETGKLFWLPRPCSMFENCAYASERLASIWNTKFSNSEAFTALNDRGYHHGDLLGKRYRAHILIWLLAHQYWPDKKIDHINGVRSDNRIINLRLVSDLENGRNQRRYRTNTSGFTGVTFDKRIGKWCAQIEMLGRAKSLGYFDDFSDAVDARKKANVTFGFHPNHGNSIT